MLECSVSYISPSLSFQGDEATWKLKVLISTIRHLAGFEGRADRLGVACWGWDGGLCSGS